MAIITISRGTFSGGQALAECVAEALGYHCITREELLNQAASEFKVPQDKLDIALAQKPGFLEKLSLRRVHYIAYIRATLIRMVQEGAAVYSGQAGHLLLRDAPQLIRVKVIADMEYRIRAAMERQGMSRDEAIDYIHKADENRDKWVKAIYNVDRNDPAGYDLVVNLEHLQMSTACRVVSAIAQSEEFQPTPESRKRLQELLVAADIRAKIALDRNIQDHDVDIEVEDGIIQIWGTVDTLQDADNIRLLVRDIPGVKDIESHLRVKRV